MTRGFRRLAAATIVITPLLYAAPAWAQASLELPLQFDFLNPGARSLALGSAFTGLADDATAGFTNPAGLTILRDPEVTFEGRMRRLENTVLAGGRLSGTLTNTGIDTVNGPLYSTGIDDSAGPSFISFVYPHNNWAIAGYRHEFVRVQASMESSGVFQGDGVRELALRGDRTLEMNAYGISAAYRFKKFASIGGSFVSYSARMNGTFNRYTPPSFFGPPAFTTTNLIGAAEQNADDTTFGFNVGGLFTLKERGTGATSGPDVVLGVVYRRVGRFDFSAFEGDFLRPVNRDSTFDSPDTLAIGLSSHVTSSLMVAVDVARVGYSSLVDGFISAQAGQAVPAANFVIDDVTEIHAGVEYVMPMSMSPSLRVGAWRDPNHSVVYHSPSTTANEDARFAAYLPAASDVTHFTFGAGVAISPRYEINGGVDVSSRTRVISLSAVIRLAQ